VATRWLNEEEQRTWRAYLSAAQMLMTRLDHELQAASGITHPYYEILVRLSEAPGRALRMSELADSSLSSRSRVSHAVNRLEELGWVRRESCPEDKRGAFAVLTEEGFRVLAEAAPHHVEGVRTHLFDQLEPDQVAALRASCEAVVAHLSSLGMEPPACPAGPLESPSGAVGQGRAGS